MERSFYEIEYEDGVLNFDDDINHLGSGISLSVYDSQGKLVYGRIPANFNGAPLLIMDEDSAGGDGMRACGMSTTPAAPSPGMGTSGCGASSPRRRRTPVCTPWCAWH